MNVNWLTPTAEGCPTRNLRRILHFRGRAAEPTLLRLAGSFDEIRFSEVPNFRIPIFFTFS